MKQMPSKNYQLSKQVGLTIAKYRQQSGLTQNEVAEKLNIGYEAVSRMERGIVMPTVERLVELAEIFNCEAADLLTQSSNRIEDQSAQIKSLLSILEDSDRVFLLDLITKLVERLKNQK
jgi:transcriptional regulator with XRE-family HTH domain